KSHVDTNGKMQFLEEEIPAFIEPEANGTTPMSLCFQKVIDFINKKYSNDSPEMPAPIIINISDGMPYLGGDLEVEEEIEPAASVKQAEKLMNISLHDGKPLLYNVHIGDSATECCFIASESDLPPNDEQAEFLFSISSKVPNEHREAAKKFGFDTPTNARGFVSNALPDTLIRFINFGSSSHTSNLN
ncbi:MAG: hypothetical protein ORN85_09785, partial [Sediminibacterium sp.]|nr:hypothetical protein [Sediminibacterium sp.]